MVKIITTLDSDIQVAAYEAIKNESGSVIVMDNFGEIITMVSSPSFDSNSFTYGISKTEYKSYLKMKKPLSNKLFQLFISKQYYQMLVALSALKNNIINKNFKMTRSRQNILVKNIIAGRKMGMALLI